MSGVFGLSAKYPPTSWILSTSSWKLTVCWTCCGPSARVISNRLKSPEKALECLGTVHEAANNHRLLSIVTWSKESLKTVRTRLHESQEFALAQI